MTPPLFTAVIMADPVIRDFRAEMDLLIFSKPVGRLHLHSGKVFWQFLCAWLRFSGFRDHVVRAAVVQPPGHGRAGCESRSLLQTLPGFCSYTHLVLAAFYFAIRNADTECQTRICAGVLFLPALHRLPGSLRERFTTALATRARSAAHDFGPKEEATFTPPTLRRSIRW